MRTSLSEPQEDKTWQGGSASDSGIGSSSVGHAADNDALPPPGQPSMFSSTFHKVKTSATPQVKTHFLPT
jgi:hypothetical protein